MAVDGGGGVERRRRLQRQRVARVERPDGAERVTQQRVDEGEPLLGDRKAGDADAVTHLVQGEFGGRWAHGETSVGWSSEDSTRPAGAAQGARRHSPLRGRQRSGTFTASEESRLREIDPSAQEEWRCER